MDDVQRAPVSRAVLIASRMAPIPNARVHEGGTPAAFATLNISLISPGVAPGL
jgi:hypothetical protein